MKKIVILISGRGSNMQAIVEAKLPLQIAAVVSNRQDAEGLVFAQQRGIATRMVPHQAFPSRERFDQALMEVLDTFQPDLVVLAGFMRILSADFVNHYAGRLINIHPSLLPAFPGLDTHQRAIDAGVKFSGCTVHFVTDVLDHGPIIAQSVVPVLPDDTAKTLAARILIEEHKIYPEVLSWFAANRLSIKNDKVYLLN